jgi:hypothetical protein
MKRAAWGLLGKMPGITVKTKLQCNQKDLPYTMNEKMEDIGNTAQQTLQFSKWVTTQTSKGKAGKPKVSLDGATRNKCTIQENYSQYQRVTIYTHMYQQLATDRKLLQRQALDGALQPLDSFVKGCIAAIQHHPQVDAWRVDGDTYHNTILVFFQATITRDLKSAQASSTKSHVVSTFRR